MEVNSIELGGVVQTDFAVSTGWGLDLAVAYDGRMAKMKGSRPVWPNSLSLKAGFA